jgi:soluble lytic murein transglycosylase-like protein
VVGRESGFNPGAVNSSSGAAGLFQFLGHPQFSTWRLLHDPAYAVDAAWSLSHGARDRSPWYGGSYNC